MYPLNLKNIGFLVFPPMIGGNLENFAGEKSKVTTTTKWSTILRGCQVLTLYPFDLFFVCNMLEMFKMFGPNIILTLWRSKHAK